MKMTEVKELSNEELVEKLENAKAALDTMKLNHQVAPMENPSQIKAARRDIARMMTELNSRNK